MFSLHIISLPATKKHNTRKGNSNTFQKSMSYPSYTLGWKFLLGHTQILT